MDWLFFKMVNTINKKKIITVNKLTKKHKKVEGMIDKNVQEL